MVILYRIIRKMKTERVLPNYLDGSKEPKLDGAQKQKTDLRRSDKGLLLLPVEVAMLLQQLVQRNIPELCKQY